MHIAFLTARYPPDVLGGGEISTRLIAEALVEIGQTVTVLCGGALDRDEMVRGVRVLRARLLQPWWTKPLNEGPLSRQTARVVRRLLQTLPSLPAIVHAHEFRSALALAQLAHPRRVVTVRDYAPICGTTNNLWWDGSICDGCFWTNVLFRCHRVAEAALPRKPFLVWQYKGNLPLRRAAFRRIPTHIYTSAVLRDRVTARLPPSLSTRTMVIPNPVEPTWLAQSVAPLPSTPTLYGFGRLEHTKGTDVLLEAFAILRRTLPAAHLHLGGGEIERYRALASQLGITQSVTFHSFLPSKQVRDLIDQATLVVSSHRWEEPFGRAALEAGARGRTLIASDLGGVRETTTPDTAVLVSPGDPQRLAEALLALLHDPQGLRTRGEAARRHVETHYNASQIARQHLAAYTKLLESF